MLLLTSYERMRRYLGNADGTALTDSAYRKNLIVNLIMSVSKQIETFLNRNLTITSYTEYFDVVKEKYIEYYTSAWPVTTLTSVYQSSSGEWDGTNETEITDCYIGIKSDSVVLPIIPEILGRKALRIIYTGGLAYNGTRSVLTIESSTGTWTAGQYAKGGTSEAVGIIRASSATTLTVENLYGIFQADETVTEYTNEACSSSGDASATISAISQQSLAEAYPDIVRAAEMQVRYLWKHKDDIELTSTNRDSTNSRREGGGAPPVSGGLLPEVVGLLLPYRKVNA